MIHFFNLIRWKNLALIALVQILIKYALLNPLKADYGLATALSTSGFVVLLFATLFIAAAGYIINDIEDIEADLINKPQKIIIDKYISEKTATTLFFIFNFTGVILGFALAYGLEKSGFFVIFVLASAILYMYSTFLKHILLVGNSIVAALIGISILLVGIFDLLPVMSLENRGTQVFFLKLILDYAIFAFLINFLRELVKDVEDIDGDYKMGVKSLPIVLGKERAKMIIFGLSLVPLFTVIFYLINNLYKQPLAIGYVLLTIIAPLIYTTLKLFSAKQKKDFTHISAVLKIVMLMGILSLLLFQFMLLK